MDAQTRSQKIENYGQGYTQLQQLLKDAPHQMWHYQPTPAQWSIAQVVVHLTDIEANNYVRYRTVAVKPNQTILGVDADAWAGAFDYQQQNIEVALELFRLLRDSNYQLLKSLPATAWENKMQHTERGEITLEQLFELQTKHLNSHVGQIAQNIEAWKEQKNGKSA